MPLFGATAIDDVCDCTMYQDGCIVTKTIFQTYDFGWKNVSQSLRFCLSSFM